MFGIVIARPIGQTHDIVKLENFFSLALFELLLFSPTTTFFVLIGECGPQIHVFYRVVVELVMEMVILAQV